MREADTAPDCDGPPPLSVAIPSICAIITESEYPAWV